MGIKSQPVLLLFCECCKLCRELVQKTRQGDHWTDVKAAKDIKMKPDHQKAMKIVRAHRYTHLYLHQVSLAVTQLAIAHSTAAKGVALGLKIDIK